MTDFFCNRGYFKTKSLLVFEKKTYAHWYQPDPTVTNLVFFIVLFGKQVLPQL